MNGLLRCVVCASVLLALEWPLRRAAAGTAHPDLYVQSVARALEQQFADEDLSFLLLDTRNGEVVAERWEEAGQPLPLGSLLKPFTALAWGEAHSFRYPQHVCHGARTGCWLPRGHGRLGLAAAIAHSCNAYFHRLAEEVHPADVSPVLERYGLSPLPTDATADERLGLGGRWRAPPAAVARAYIQLATRTDDPGTQEILHGMMLSGEVGTGGAVGRAVPGRAALVKTGTAPCTHTPGAPGDGFVVVLYPATSPQFALLVRRHGAPGSEAASSAGEMLRVIAKE
ncbi:MAG TPA: penicillin-binding transpeptidase domain-containing protein [Terriglobales bacterium]|nr:penicillin-binding transpeptidase domain-containing protein [Terriglobales bacterium]